MASFNDSVKATFSASDTWASLAGLHDKTVVWNGKLARAQLDENHPMGSAPIYTIELVFDDQARTQKPIHDFDEVLATLLGIDGRRSNDESK
jgi:hypothetical protein